MLNRLTRFHQFLKEIDFFLIVYYLSIAAILIGFLYSRALLSIGQISMAANFLLEGDFKTKIEKLKARPLALYFAGFYLLHVLFLLNTSDMEYALEDLRIKLPLLLFPIVLGSRDFIDRRAFRITMALFVTVIFSGSLLIWLRYSSMSAEITDIREASFLISHIRFALMICLAIMVILYYIPKTNRILSILLILLSIYFGVFMWRFTYMTGIGILFVLLVLMFFWYLRKSSIRPFFKKAILTTAFLGFLSAGIYALYAAREYYLANKIKEVENLIKSPDGHGYYHWHDAMNIYIRENGYLVYQNLCLEEMQAEWNNRSEIKIDYTDDKNTPVEGCLLRFITSQGKPKDGASVRSLSKEEVQAIESGITNVKLIDKSIVYLRFHNLFWQYDVYMCGGDINGHSLGMRLEFWKTGWKIFRKNFWLGTGTGDIENAFQEQYEEDNSKLRPEWRFRSHNQYISVAATFGILGLIYFLVMGFIPLYFQRRNFLYVAFSLIFLTSILTEDTLETQIGVTFYAFFNALLFFQNREKTVDQERIEPSQD